MLRFGDGTPFPYGQDFLDVLVDAVEACTAMFEAADELDRERARAREAKRDRDAEDKRLEQLEKAIAATVAATVPPSNAAGTAHSQRAAKRTLATVKRTLDESRAQLKKLYAVAAAGPRWEPTAMRIQEAAAVFFERRCLPDTRWLWSWDGERPVAEATMRSGIFGATFDLEPDPVWRAPVRIGVLADGMVARLPKPRVFGAAAVSELALDRMYLVRAARTREGVQLVVRAHQDASQGWQITTPSHAPGSQATVVALDKRGRAVGLDYELGREDVMARLLGAVETAIGTMLRNRRAREVTLGDQQFCEISDATIAGKALLDTLAPTIRAIRAKSKTPGELSLKRDVAAGVREELFVPRDALTARYAKLSATYRTMLDHAGLGQWLDNTSQVVITSATLPGTAAA